MEDFSYRDGALCAGPVPLADLAERFGTPCYVYSADAMTRRVREMDDALGSFPHRILYAVKANSNLAVLQHMARLGCGFDVVSGGELARVRASGGDPGATAFSGVGKTEQEIKDAIGAGVSAFHIESREEYERMARLAEATGEEVPVCVRVNPEIEVETHPHIATALRDSKFGVAAGEVPGLCRDIARGRWLRLRGLACHIGSQLLDLEPLVEAARQMVGLVDQVREAGMELEVLDLGGGLGVRYRDEAAPSVAEYADRLLPILEGRGLTLLLEPGRSLVAGAGILLTRVEYRKRSPAKNFLVVDAAMTELMRPALYGAWHEILPVCPDGAGEEDVCDVVGPVCESGDFLGRNRRLAARPGDLLAVCGAGAYAASLGSTYNSRPQAAEVMVEGGRVDLVRERGEVAALYACERLREDV